MVRSPHIFFLSPIILLIFLLSTCTSQTNTNITYPQGGYSYPSPTTIKDSNDYTNPVRDQRSTRDSFNKAYYGYYWGLAFHEPNLSIRPIGRDVFRFYYSSVFGNEIIITLTSDMLTVKESTSGHACPLYDTTKLTTLETSHFNFLRSHFPIKLKEYPLLDSLAQRYPQLLDPHYYRYLLDKSAYTDTNFHYTTKKIPLSTSYFVALVNEINNSGYWKLPYKLPGDDCTDADGFMLEANTFKKYNIVSASSCSHAPKDFMLACQHLVNTAQLEKKITLYFTPE